MNYEQIIKNVLNNDVKNIEEVSHTNNIVYRVVLKSNEIVYAKFYLNNSSHIDHELELYDLIDDKYLKKLIYSSDSPKMAIYKEVRGKTIDELTDDELVKYSDIIIESLCEFFMSVSGIHVDGYGILDNDMCGTSDDFLDFLIKRQTSTAEKLKDYPYLTNLFSEIYQKYKDIIKKDNTLIPIDTNMKNVMILDSGEVKFIDPGELISAPKLMGYGDFVSHVYKTVLYDKLIDKLSLNLEDEKLLRIYAIFSSLNILAFLHNLGVEKLDEIIPFGNHYTFYDLISEHVNMIGMEDYNKKYIKK